MPAKTTRPAIASSLKASARRKSGKNRPYVNFFRIGALELERWRKEQERALALEKIAAAGRRLAEIDQEIGALLKETSRDGSATPEPISAQGRAAPAGPGFNIKY